MSAAAMDTTDVLLEYAALENEKFALKAKLDDIEKKQKEREPKVLEQFQQRGVDRFTAFGRTIYLERKVNAGFAEPSEPLDGDALRVRAIEALRSAGFDEFISTGIVWQSLSALVREREREGESPIPPSLTGIFEVKEQFNVRSRKSG